MAADGERDRAPEAVDTTVTRPATERRIDEYWSWAAVALFLLVTVDLLTTLAAAQAVGSAAETNPLVRWALGRSVTALAAVNVAAVVLVAVCFRVLMALFRRTPEPYRRGFGIGIELWLGLLLAAGLLVFANNLVVVVFGTSLL